MPPARRAPPRAGGQGAGRGPGKRRAGRDRARQKTGPGAGRRDHRGRPDRPRRPGRGRRLAGVPERAPKQPGGGDRAMKPARIGLLVTIFGAAFCLSCLYLAMRGLMRLGGQVLSGVGRGGAPGWIWVVPVSIILGLAMIFASIFMNQRAEGVNIAMPAWSALF